MAVASSGFFFGCLGLFLAAVIIQRRRKVGSSRLPPGPPGIPILGNVLDLLKVTDWVAYKEWGRLYDSDILHLKLFGTHVIVLNSTKATKDLFEKRSNIYSDRVHMVMLHELTGWHRNVGFMEYGDIWRAHRRALHQHFRPQSISIFHSQMTRKAYDLLISLKESPAAFLEHYRYTTGSLALDISYGLKIGQSDPILEIADKGTQSLIQIANAGAYLVDSLPILKYLSAWFPGASFKRQAAIWKQEVDALYLLPYEQARSKWKQANLRPSLAATLFRAFDEGRLGDYTSARELIINVAGVAYAAGTDTTVTALKTFTLAMLLYPEVQVKAREELGRLTKNARLLVLEDRELLPYTTAIVKEVLRWHTIVPLAVAHKSTADDEYRGFFIPAGSIVIGNSWAILRDEDQYPKPDVFDPCRFLTAEGEMDPNVPDPDEAFGYGRRICPGRYFATDVLWLMIANMLATFAIVKPVDEYGKVVEPKEEFTHGFFSIPASVEASFQPLSEEAEQLISSLSVSKE